MTFSRESIDGVSSKQMVAVWPPWPRGYWFADDKTDQALPPNKNCFHEATAFQQFSEWIHEYESHVGEKFRVCVRSFLNNVLLQSHTATPAKFQRNISRCSIVVNVGWGPALRLFNDAIQLQGVPNPICGSVWRVLLRRMQIML